MQFQTLRLSVRRLAARFFLISLLSLLPISGFANSLDYLVNGEYAFYLDTRGTEPYYRGFLAIKSDELTTTVLARVVNLNTMGEWIYVFTIQDDDKGAPQVTSIKGQAEGTNEVVMQSMLDFLNFTQLYLKNSETIHPRRAVKDAWDGKTYDFIECLPFFKFKNIKVDGSNETCYQLDRAGILNGDNIADFRTFAYSPAVESARQVRTLEIPKAQKKKIVLNGTSVRADENWLFNDHPGSPGIWLQLNTARDSQLMIERLAKERIASGNNLYDLIKRMLLMEPGLDYRSLEFSEDGWLSYYMLDLDNHNIKNYYRTNFKELGDEYLIINFSSFADVYDNNRNYYDRLIGSIELEKDR